MICPVCNYLRCHACDMCDCDRTIDPDTGEYIEPYPESERCQECGR